MTARLWTAIALVLSLCLPSAAMAQSQLNIRGMFGGHAAPITAVAYSPDGTLAATASGDGTHKLWHLPDGALIRTTPTANILTTTTDYGLAFSPDGSMLVSGEGSSVVVRRVTDGAQLQSLSPDSTPCDSVAFSPDGSTVAAGYGDGMAYLFNVSNGQLIGTIQPSTTNAVQGLAFSSDGKKLATASSDGNVKLWNTVTGSLLHTWTVGANQFTNVVISPDGDTVAAAGSDGIIRLWNVANGVSQGTLAGHTGAVDGLAFSNSSTLVSGSLDGTIRVWNTAKRTPISIFTSALGAVGAVAVSPNQTRILSGGVNTPRAEIRKIADGSLVQTLGVHTDWVHSFAFSPDGTLLAAESWDSTVTLWRVADGTLLHTFPNNGNYYWSTTRVIFSPDGSLLAACNNTGVNLYDVATGTLVQTFNTNGIDAWSVVFSPDGSLLAAGINHDIHIWRLADGALLQTLTGHTDKVASLIFSSDGTVLYSGGYDDIIKYWRVSDGTNLMTIDAHGISVDCMVLSPDGKTLATGHDDATIKLFNVADGSLLGVLKGHTDWVVSLVYTPDGASLMSSSNFDQTVRFWNVQTQTLVQTYSQEMGSGPLGVAISPNGALCVYGRSDATFVVADNPLLTLGLPIAYVAVDETTTLGGTNPGPIGTVALGNAAPAGGATVSLTSSDPSNVAVPATVIVPAGQYTATFPITTRSVTALDTVTLSASYNGATKTTTLNVRPIFVSNLGVNPASIHSFGTAIGTVLLEAPAGPGGVTVNLSSNSNLVVVPARVTVAQGGIRAWFPIIAGTVPTDTSVTVSASVNGQSSPQTAGLIVQADSSTLKSVSVTPGAVGGGANAVGTVRLAVRAPVGGVTVNLTSSDTAYATVPATVTVPAGAFTQTFAVQTSSVTSANAVKIRARYGIVTRFTLLKVVP